VIQALVIVAATALAAGSLGGLVALWRERTFQTLALTALFLVLYLCVIRALAVLPELAPGLSAEAVRAWQTRLEPFLALRSVWQPLEAAGLRVAPAYGFALVMAAVCVLLNGFALLKLRVWNPSGEPVMQRETPLGAAAEERTAPPPTPPPARCAASVPTRSCGARSTPAPTAAGRSSSRPRTSWPWRSSATTR
jgi:hypothetical protein